MKNPSPSHLSHGLACVVPDRLTRTLDRSLLQGHILPSRRPRHPQPAPLVLQVLVAQHVIGWGEGFGVLGLPTPLSHVLACGFLSLLRTFFVFSSRVAFSIPHLFSHCL